MMKLIIWVQKRKGTRVIFQQYFPQSLSQLRLDRYLADGWFRCQDFLYRSQLVSFEGDLFSIVHIRLPLDDYKMSKRMRRIVRRNEGQMYCEVGEVTITPEKERLYREHKQKFKGRILPSLEDYLFGDSRLPLFDTKELCVYDGNKLVAVSFFDQGRDSIASLLGLYDREYKKNSLGSYTMLLEIDYARKTGKKYYYPGYVVEESSIFDYKLNLGPMEYYNWFGQWEPLSTRPPTKTISQKLKEKMNLMQNCLGFHEIPSEQQLYAYFSMGYIEEETFVKGAIFLFCTSSEQYRGQLIIEYDLEEETYVLSHVYSVDFEELEDVMFAEDQTTRPLYCFDLLAYEEILCHSHDPHEIAEYILANT